MNTTQPIAFISHASEDKDTFVIPFAKRLQKHGIDVWVDKWEMLPGDSLVDKIFEEGIKNASAFVIVLSSNSVQKPWVREELNAGLVQKINGHCKVIPVVIEDCEIPVALQSIVWEPIEDLDSYDEELNRIVAAIHDISLKPNVGTSPGYTQLTIDALPGFSQIDMLVLKAICERSLVVGNSFVNTSNILKTLEANDISQEQTYESLEILDEKRFIEAEQSIASRGIDFFDITIYGFENYANLFIPDFDNLVNRTLTAIINEGLLKNGPLSKYLDSPIVFVNYILDILANRNFIKKVNYLGGSVEILDVTASGKRAARNI